MIYLHNEQSSHSKNSFIGFVLSNENLLKEFEQHCVFWACDISDERSKSELLSSLQQCPELNQTIAAFPIRFGLGNVSGAPHSTVSSMICGKVRSVQSPREFPLLYIIIQVPFDEPTFTSDPAATLATPSPVTPSTSRLLLPLNVQSAAANNRFSYSNAAPDGVSNVAAKCSRVLRTFRLCIHEVTGTVSAVELTAKLQCAHNNTNWRYLTYRGTYLDEYITRLFEEFLFCSYSNMLQTCKS